MLLVPALNPQTAGVYVALVLCRGRRTLLRRIASPPVGKRRETVTVTLKKPVPDGVSASIVVVTEAGGAVQSTARTHRILGV